MKMTRWILCILFSYMLSTVATKRKRQPKLKVIAYHLQNIHHPSQLPPKYVTYGLIHNLYQSRQIYPDWVVRIYADHKLPKKYLNMFNAAGGEVHKVEMGSVAHGLLVPFMVADDPLVERFIIRNAHCRLSFIEKKAVDEWIKSNKMLHVIRASTDHFNYPIVPELWGARGIGMSYDRPMTEEITEFLKKIEPTDATSDVKFLRDYIWNHFARQGDVLVHQIKVPHTDSSLIPNFGWCPGDSCVPIPTVKVPDSFKDAFYLGKTFKRGKALITLKCEDKICSMIEIDPKKEFAKLSSHGPHKLFSHALNKKQNDRDSRRKDPRFSKKRGRTTGHKRKRRKVKFTMKIGRDV